MMKLLAAACAAFFVSTVATHAADSCRPAADVVVEMQKYGAAISVFKGVDYVDRYKRLIKAAMDLDIAETADGIVLFRFPAGALGVAMLKGEEMCIPCLIKPEFSEMAVKMLTGPSA